LPQLIGALPSLGRSIRRLPAPNRIDKHSGETAMRYRQSMDSALDVLIFLGYAAMLGLCVGALLGALALVLASPAHAAGDGAANLLLRPAPDAAASAAPLLSTDTVFRSDGPIQRVRVVQAFRNPFHVGMEGLYVMRLPTNAILERLTLTVRGVAEEEVDEAGEEAIEPLASHSFVRPDEPGLVTRFISGIEPGETVLVEVEYQQVARYDRGRAILRVLTQLPTQLAALGRRRRLRLAPCEAVPLGVEGAWLSASRRTGASWLWLLPVVALYALVAFFN
jgi:hypothetical protein